VGGFGKRQGEKGLTISTFGLGSGKGRGGGVGGGFLGILRVGEAIWAGFFLS